MYQVKNQNNEKVESFESYGSARRFVINKLREMFNLEVDTPYLRVLDNNFIGIELDNNRLVKVSHFNIVDTKDNQSLDII